MLAAGTYSDEVILNVSEFMITEQLSNEDISFCAISEVSKLKKKKPVCVCVNTSLLIQV